MKLLYRSITRCEQCCHYRMRKTKVGRFLPGHTFHRCDIEEDNSTFTTKNIPVNFINKTHNCPLLDDFGNTPASMAIKD